jgi:hypothetical protein
VGEDPASAEVDELELQGGRVYLHLGPDETSHAAVAGLGHGRTRPRPGGGPATPAAAFGFVKILAVVDHEAGQDEDDDEAVED